MFLAPYDKNSCVPFITFFIFVKKPLGENDVGHNFLFNFCDYLILVFLRKICYFRFRLFIFLFLGAFNAF